MSLPYSQLDEGLIIRSVTDDTTQTLRTSIVGTVTTTSTAGGLSAIAAPQFLAAASINAYGGAYTQLIASTTGIIKQIQLYDTTGVFLVIAVGAPGSEVETLITGPGNDSGIPCNIAAGSRISIKSREASAPVSGNIALNFLG